VAPPAAVSASTNVSAPRTGVEIVATDERDGSRYHTMRDLRNGSVVKNVTRSSARKLWHYAISAKESGALNPEHVSWQGDVGLWRKTHKGGTTRYDLVQRGNGEMRVYYGVTEDGIHGAWRRLVEAEDHRSPEMQAAAAEPTTEAPVAEPLTEALAAAEPAATMAEVLMEDAATMPELMAAAEPVLAELVAEEQAGVSEMAEAAQAPDAEFDQPEPGDEPAENAAEPAAEGSTKRPTRRGSRGGRSTKKTAAKSKAPAAQRTSRKATKSKAPAASSAPRSRRTTPAAE
jgi:hypothetical protein